MGFAFSSKLLNPSLTQPTVLVLKTTLVFSLGLQQPQQLLSNSEVTTDSSALATTLRVNENPEAKTILVSRGSLFSTEDEADHLTSTGQFVPRNNQN